MYVFKVLPVSYVENGLQDAEWKQGDQLVFSICIVIGDDDDGLTKVIAIEVEDVIIFQICFHDVSQMIS